MLIFYVKVTVFEFCYNPIFFRWGGMVDVVSDEKKIAFNQNTVGESYIQTTTKYWIHFEIGP